MAHRRIAIDPPIRTEPLAAAAASIKPGMLIRKASATTFNVHNVAGGQGGCRILLENEEMGSGVTTAVTNGEQAKIGHFCTGQRFAGLIKSGEVVAVDDALESDGAGGLRKHVDDSSAGTIEIGSIIAYCDEAGTGNGTTLFTCVAA